MMPDVWHTYSCEPCRATMAVGGDWHEVGCPRCGYPMARLTESWDD